MPHIINTIKPKDKLFNKEFAIESCNDWIVGQFALLCCARPPGSSNRNTVCTCMKILALPENAALAMMAAQYMVHWAGLSRVIRREVIHEWKKVASYLNGPEGSARGKKIYMLPTLTAPDQNYLVCRNGVLGLLGIGRVAWKTAVMDPNKGYAMKDQHGALSSKGKSFVEIHNSMRAFFVELATEGLPFATRIIREETGMTLRDDNPDEVVLAPHVSKRQCYARWCFGRGWIVEKKNSATSVMMKLSEYTPRPHDDVDDDDIYGVSLWPTGSEGQRICTWPTFHSFWKNHFGYIKIRKRGADTCTDCLVLTNEFRMRRARIENGRAIAEAEGDDGEEEDSESGSGSDENDDANEVNPIEAEIEAVDATLVKAKAHVRNYQIQRQKAKDIISIARLDITYILPSLFRRKVLTIDMGQNLCLPNFEGDQPGDTYYMSPLTVLLFGVVNNATIDGKDRMNAYIWQEFEGDRGANNIASCLLMDLKKRGWLNGQNYGELTYIADNCGGQNKNKIVVRFLMWLVENKVFPKVTLCFLVKGHTKNAADRMFNLLKLSYHAKDIYTYNELHAVLNENKYINVMQMRKENFHDHLEWQDQYYRAPAGGEFNQTHVFTICGNRHGRVPTLLMKQDNNEAANRPDSLLPTRRNRKARRLNPEERARSIKKMEDDLKQLTPTPLRPIKQVELWKKWAPLLPEYARAITCPKPPDEVIALIKTRNREKTRKKTEEKNSKKKEGMAVENSAKSAENIGVNF